MIIDPRFHKICYAYLYDVKVGDLHGTEFASSAWWTRGWTLQELIAPITLEFCNSSWTRFGTRDSLKHEISSITGIDVAVLEGKDPEGFSIAKRMSWASRRTTTRIEDAAYSLLGIFGVNMPMLYGEGEKAFIRLQEEILKNSNDQSIFAWTSNADCHRGLLAKSPAAFSACRNVCISENRRESKPYSITNMGLSIEVPMLQWSMHTYAVSLNCEHRVNGKTSEGRVGIFLRLLPEPNQYARIAFEGKDTMLFPIDFLENSKIRRIYVRQKVWSTPLLMDQLYGFKIRRFPELAAQPKPEEEEQRPVIHVSSHNDWDQTKRVLEIPTGSSGTAGVIVYRAKAPLEHSGFSVLKFGFDNDFNLVCKVGGSIYSPATTSWDPVWMREKDTRLYIGDRIRGINANPPYCRLLIQEEVVENRKMWVVDFEQGNNGNEMWVVDYEQGNNGNAVCDGCNLRIIGVRHKCKSCDDFDYCENCYETAIDTHDPCHKFDTMDGKKII